MHTLFYGWPVYMDPLLSLWAGFFLDLIFGDPSYPFHPIRLLGREISFFERKLRDRFPKTRSGERAAGIVLTVLVIFSALLVPGMILFLCGRVSRLLKAVIEAVFCYQLLATKSLKTESMKVCRRLEAGDLEGARQALSMIVGRDTEVLDEEGMTKAAVETVAENASDGSLAPMFYMMLFGSVGGFVYKAVNTMDSMVGYRNDRYMYFGTAAARCDDVLNFIPSRLTALLMILCAGGKHFSRKNAWKIFRRDRYNHASPNSAQTESVMAGALSVQLAGDAWYFGKLVRKKTIGDPIRKIVPGDIRLANTLLYRTAFAGMLIGTVLRLVSML